MTWRGVLLPLLLASALSAQSFVLPSQYANVAGNGSDYNIFYGPGKTPMQPVHTQLIYNVADIPLPAGGIKSIAFRRANSTQSTNYAASADLTIQMGQGNYHEANAVADFAANLGANPRLVFQGKVNLPQSVYSGPGPGVFEVLIPFSTPFVFINTMGPGLVVDITTTTFTSTGTGKEVSWYVDAQRMTSSTVSSQGTQGPSQSNCKFNTGTYSNSRSTPGIYGPGHIFSVTLGGLLANAPGIHFLGTKGSGSVWNGLQLPWNMAPLGAPNCYWVIEIVLGVPIVVGASGSHTLNLRVPADPVLAGATFHEQALILDPLANPFGAVATWAGWFKIGDSKLPGGAMVYKSLDTTPPSPTGTLATTAVIAEFGL